MAAAKTSEAVSGLHQLNVPERLQSDVVEFSHCCEGSAVHFEHEVIDRHRGRWYAIEQCVNDG